MAKAKAPNNPYRPESQGVKRAIAAGDMEALHNALSVRQRAFCKEFVVDYEGSAAAIRAGYAPKYADRQAHLLKNHAGVSKYIEHLTMSKAAKIASISPDYLIQRLIEVMNKEGIRTADELRAIEMGMKHLGMFIDRQEITGKDGEAIRIQEQRIAEEADSFVNTIRRIANKSSKDSTIL